MSAASELPLDGIRVLEFTHAVMGPTAGLILGDLGAEVIHIEPPSGDSTRRLKGFGTGYFPFYSRNKKSLAVNLKSNEGRQIIQQLLPTADVLVENFGPGTMDRLGFGYDAVRAHNERLIYLSLKGFGAGPYEQRTAMDEVVQMMGGLAYMTGPPGKPLRAGTSIIDIGGGMFGTMAVILALYERERTGRGTLVRSSLFETTAFFMGQHMAYSALSDRPVPPMPARVSAWSIYRTFDTADGESVFIGIISDRHWQSFCQVFERSDWAQDTRLATNNDRIDHREWLLPAVETLLSNFSRNHIIARCEEAGIPFAPIARPEDLFEDPQLNQQQGGLLATVLPDGTNTRLPRLPIAVGNYDFGLRSDPPAIGSATQELLESLGYEARQIADLHAVGAIASPMDRHNDQSDLD
ncbi:MAG: formyl-CoA transferase [Rickettsiales bacterium]|nr:formyl-CoA transferase [Rickettsiales bacterium]